MTEIPVMLAVEDTISEIVIRTIISRSMKQYCVGTVFNRGGFGYLRKTAPGWNNAAKSTPFILLTDLDKFACPTALINDWLEQPRHPNFVFRVAVREVEAWILADTKNFSVYLGISADRFPNEPEALSDPKQTLVGLAAKSRKTSIRIRLVPRLGSTAKQGPDYNSCLGEFVTKHWDIERSCDKSKSLLHCVTAINSFRPTWTLKLPAPK